MTHHMGLAQRRLSHDTSHGPSSEVRSTGGPQECLLRVVHRSYCCDMEGINTFAQAGQDGMPLEGRCDGMPLVGRCMPLEGRCGRWRDDV